jgi:hypothetical protein
VANLSISAVCNQRCPYCFTRDHLADGRDGEDFLRLDDFDARLDFLERSGIDQARFLGGEPTLHPQFPELVARARARDKQVVVFTNGLMSQDALACLERLSPTACTVLVNVNSPEETPEHIFQRQRETLLRLRQCASLSFNIHRVDFQPNFLLSLIAETDCGPSVRLGLAQPCLSGSNRYVYPHQYVVIGEKIVRFARAAGQSDVTVTFDCGFVRCMFSDEDLQTLESLEADVGWRCNPILDVDINGQVIYCYPLAELGGLPLTPQVDASTLRDAFESRTKAYREAGVFPECSTCHFKRAGVCPGGCLAMSIRRFRQTPFALDVPQEVDG